MEEEEEIKSFFGAIRAQSRLINQIPTRSGRENQSWRRANLFTVPRRRGMTTEASVAGKVFAINLAARQQSPRHMVELMGEIKGTKRPFEQPDVVLVKGEHLAGPEPRFLSYRFL